MDKVFLQKRTVNCLMLTLLFVAFCVLMAPVSASASYTSGFTGITSNNAGDVLIGQGQISVDISDYGSGQVLFNFKNVGSNDSSITSVHFDDGSLLGISSLIDADDGTGGDKGVDFSPIDKGSENLPGGNLIGFITTAGFAADSDPPVQPQGVNPGETLGVIFDLQGGQSFNNVIYELGTGALRIGIHVQGFASGGSESFINGPQFLNVPVPEPELITLLGISFIGIAGVMTFTWKRKRRQV